MHIMMSKRQIIVLLYPGRGRKVTVKHDHKFVNIKTKCSINSNRFDVSAVVSGEMMMIGTLLRDSATQNIR